MSYQEKKTVVSILTGLLLLAAYLIYVFNKVNSGLAATDDLKFWAITILIFIGIGIIASIIILIIFHIFLSIATAVKEQIRNGKYDGKKTENTIEDEMVEDEMDKLIGLKSMRIGFAIAGIGFVLALLALALNYSSIVMINIIFFSFSIGSMAEGITQLFFYRRGVKND